MTESEKITVPGEIWSHFDLGEATKVISILAAFAYATGVIAINTYLHGLGIVDFSFAKPKLLLTGIVVLFTYLLLASPAFFVAWSMATRHEQTARRLSSLGHIAILFVGSLMLLLGASVFSCLQTHPSMGQSTVWQVWRITNPGGSVSKRLLASLLVTLAVYLPVLLAAVSVYVAARLFDRETAERPVPQISLSRFSLVMAVAVFVVATIGYICVFTNTFYSVIPQEFGGGQPYFQSYAVPEEDICQLQQLGIPFTAERSNITQPLPVLHETDTMVAVWLRDTSKEGWSFVVTELDRNLITATKVVAGSDNPSLPQLSSLPCKD
jgi:uncharacterized SAM-binding protein YcdF (DUF218 family)